MMADKPEDDSGQDTSNSRWLSLLGWGVTAIWIFVCAYVVFGAWWDLPFVIDAPDKANKLGGLNLNEWGDYLAGFMAPLAFLWLVIGYMQNTKALKLQQKELSFQVEELRKTVAANEDQAEELRQQTKLLRADHDRIENERASAAQPNLVITNFHQSEIKVGGSNKKQITSWKFRNVGADVAYFSLYRLGLAASLMSQRYWRRQRLEIHQITVQGIGMIIIFS